jgi:hypothetical protein
MSPIKNPPFRNTAHPYTAELPPNYAKKRSRVKKNGRFEALARQLAAGAGGKAKRKSKPGQKITKSNAKKSGRKRDDEKITHANPKKF